MALTDEDILDIVNSTQKDLGRDKWTDLSTGLQEFEVAGRLFSKDKVSFQSGTGIRTNFMLSHNAGARHVGLAEADVLNIKDHSGKNELPWRHTTNNYNIIKQLISMNSESVERIWEYIKMQRLGAMMSLYELIEAAFWGKPLTSADETTPWGIQMSVVLGTPTDPDGDFTAPEAAGFPSGYGGLVNARFKNWIAEYAAITKDDLIRKLRRAYYSIRFKSPHAGRTPDYARGIANNFRIYVPLEVILAFEEVGQGQNENLGPELAKYDGQMVFNGNPVVWVPYLDADAKKPVYLLNFNYLYIGCLQDWYLRETVQPSATQHTVISTFVDLTWNPINRNRRAHAVITKV